MDLFESAHDRATQPLAYRMRPRNLDEFSGQEHIVGPGRLLRRVIQADRLSSLIFYGPPGTGKTTLARVIANTTRSHFITMNAVLSGVKDLREAIAEAQEHNNLYERRTILFVDEVHRWNKAQQDALLPWVENGTVVLIGATTQNPYFEVNSALVSRSRIFQLKPLTDDDLRRIARTAINDTERGYGAYDLRFDEEALEHLVRISNGDARSLLNAVELAVETTPDRFPPPPGSAIHVDTRIAEESIQKRIVLYDKEGDYHFDTISAFIKSLRGSDPDAALYWMAKMVHAGEDPHYILRRMLILAGEDIGMADPNALVVVQAAAGAFDRVGMPEGQFHLAEAALYLATAPKSNTTLGFFDAVKAVEEEAAEEVPTPLRDAGRDAKGFGHGEGYLYPHAYRDHWVAQQYLPSGLQGRIFYQPSDQGHEGAVQDQVLRRREAQLAAYAEESPDEVLTYSPGSRARDGWIARINSRRSDNLCDLRTAVFSELSLRRHDRVLDLAAGSGLLMWEAFRMVPEGTVCGIVESERDLAALEHHSRHFDSVERPQLINKALDEALKALLESHDLRFEAIVGHNPVTRSTHRAELFEAAGRLLAPGGRLVLAQVIPARSERLSTFADPGALPDGVLARVKNAEVAFYTGEAKTAQAHPLLGWDERDILRDLESAGLNAGLPRLRSYAETRRIRMSDIDSWLSDKGSHGSYATMLAEALSSEELQVFRGHLRDTLADSDVEWRSCVAFVVAVQG